MLNDPNGHLPQSVVDFSAGFGGALLLGQGGRLRDALDIGGVNIDSGAYEAGAWASVAAGGARIAYAGIAKIGALTAASGVEASAFRAGLKDVFRLGQAKNFREPDLLKYADDAALKAAAGRTNLGINAYGAGVLGSGLNGVYGGSTWK